MAQVGVVTKSHPERLVVLLRNGAQLIAIEDEELGSEIERWNFCIHRLKRQLNQNWQLFAQNRCPERDRFFLLLKHKENSILLSGATTRSSLDWMCISV